MLRSSATHGKVNKWLLNRVPELDPSSGHVGFEEEAKFDARFSRSFLVLPCELVIQVRSTFISVFYFVIAISVPCTFYYFVQ